tara:strand:+ start:42 stop:623 length:582 start_codon:yes stop_codon:yes gene_type:complete
MKLKENHTSEDEFDTDEEMPIFPKVVQPLKCFKLFPEAHLPVLGSEWSACFDLKASFRSGDVIKYYDERNTSKTTKATSAPIALYGGCRMLVPTGLIFDLHPNESMRIHPRSGLSLKHGITVANCEGIVDADYVQQTYVLLYNISSETFLIDDGMRIAQAELIDIFEAMEIREISIRPEQKTSRNGGFGSTGT